MQVLKFGGSSVASSEAMLRVIEIVRKALEESGKVPVPGTCPPPDMGGAGVSEANGVPTGDGLLVT